MPRGRARPKAIDTPYFSFKKPLDLFECLEEMITKHGYQGAVSGHTEPDGRQIWGIALHSTLQHEFLAELGEVILWDENELRKISQEEFAERWST